MKNCRVAIVGAGLMGREHLKAFQAVPGVSVVGLQSRTRTRAEGLAKEFGVPAVYDTIEEMYEATKADLVVVTVIELSMKEVSFECFKYPWTVLLEKPAGYNFEQAREIEREAHRNLRKVFVALNRRFNSSTRAALSQLSEVEGNRYIRIQDCQDQVTALKAGQPEEVVKNWMFANSIHVIDLMRTFARGGVAEVTPIKRWCPERPDTVVAFVKFASGDEGLYEGIWNGPGPWAATIVTPMLRFEIRPLEKAQFQKKGERRLHEVSGHEWDSQFKPGLRLQAEMAVKAAFGEATELPTISDSLESVTLVQRIFQG